MQPTEKKQCAERVHVHTERDIETVVLNSVLTICREGLVVFLWGGCEDKQV